MPRAEGDPDGMRERLRSFDIDASEDPDVLWNFEKFLIGRDGEVIQRFSPMVEPENADIVGAIEKALAN